MTPTPFKYRDQLGTVELQGQRVIIRHAGQVMTGRYRAGTVQLDTPHPIAVEAGAVLRGQVLTAPVGPSPEALVRAEVRQAIGAVPDRLSTPARAETCTSGGGVSRVRARRTSISASFETKPFTS